MAAHLRAWQPRRDEGWRERDQGYDLASYFCWRCGKERARYHASLLDARDDWVRVAGAVYLGFEDEKKGIAALKKLASLKGNPGTWAALTLARRGHKDAVPRLLEAFGPLTEAEEATGMSGVPRDNLRGRALVLLSNSARNSKVSAPPLPSGKDEEKEFAAVLTKWWKTHQDKLTLQDPWVELLAKQKID